jgi:hypothetical protein
LARAQVDSGRGRQIDVHQASAQATRRAPGASVWISIAQLSAGQSPYLYSQLSARADPVGIRSSGPTARALPGEIGLVDVSYQPDCLGPKPISHAALLADYLNGKLEPNIQADQRLRDLSKRMTARHEFEPPTSEPGNLQHYSWVDPEFLEIKQRVLDLKDIQPEGYQGCATLFEREEMMMTAVRYAGCHLESERITELLSAWVAAEILTLDEANQLSSWAPIGRFNDDWYQG